MREIKFRAWDKKTNEISDVLVIDWLNGVVDLTDGRIERIFEEVVLMQRTGLKDKNDIEIYEGDVLFWTSNVMNRKEWIGVVEKIGAMYVVRTSKKSYNTGAWLNAASNAKSIEVIGNIYENPDLLKEIKKD